VQARIGFRAGRAAAGDGFPREPQQHRVVSGPHLPQEQTVHDPRGLHELREGLAFVFRKRGNVSADVCGREPRGHGAKLGHGRQGRLLHGGIS
jgi:hypothetical protein